jgi:hypothetical protein
MALNFPDNPQTGDTYLAPNNQLYLYDGEKWIGFVTPAGTIAQGITFVGDDSTGTRISDNETIKIAGAGTITTSMSGDTITITGSASAQGITFVGDDSTGTRVSDGESFKVTGTQNITTAVSGDTLTITGPNLSSYATQSYVTSQGYITNSPITVVGDDSTGVTLNSGETIKIAGTQNISTAVSGDTLTITGPNLSSYLTNSTLTFVGDDSTGVTLNSGETIKIAGSGSITTAVSGDTITITGSASAQGITFVGDDSTGTRVSDGESFKIAGSGSVTTAVSGDTLTITGTTSSLVNSTKTVSLGSDGSLTSNGALTIKTPDGIPTSVSNWVGQGGWNQNLYTNLATTGGTGTGLTVDVAAYGAGYILIGAITINTPGTGYTAGDVITIDNENSLPGTFTIGVAGTRSWAFGIGGDLTVPGAIDGLGNSKLDFNTYGANTAYLTTTSDDTTALFMGTASAELYAQTNILIRTNTDETAKVWTFGDDGSVTFPDSTTQNTAASITIVGDDSTGVTLNAGETIKIAGAGSITTAVSGDTITITGTGGGASIGDLTVDGTTISSGSSSKITLNESVDITGTLQVNDINSADSSAIQINDGVNVSGTLTANTIQTNEISSTESSAIQINDSLNASGTITATTFVTHGTGGSITGVNTLQVNEISSADSTAIQINDSVNISGTLNAKTLVANTISSEDSTAIQINDGLRISGDLTFSDNTVQTTAYVTASGNWTVTTGTNTYSFTVPVDGTYTMWVKGNIANGIIIWNATVSVSNSNVAAIGYQYAWNYTGGGSPILLTAIPDQIRGSAGTISTDATYTGITSNRFDFGIANSSGASQTIYYGYAKIS